MLTLYSKPGACSLADYIVLHWVGAPFEVRIVDATMMKAPDFLALNPSGAVPVLTDGDWVLTQNAAILNYLADRCPEATLGGDGSPEGRAEVNRWLALLNADLHPAFHPLFGSTKYLDDADAIDCTCRCAGQAPRCLLAERLANNSPAMRGAPPQRLRATYPQTCHRFIHTRCG